VDSDAALRQPFSQSGDLPLRMCHAAKRLGHERDVAERCEGGRFGTHVRDPKVVAGQVGFQLPAP
jgi:hypothetical protein